MQQQLQKTTNMQIATEVIENNKFSNSRFQIVAGIY